MRTPVPGGLAFPAGTALAVAVTFLVVADGATSQPVISVVGLVAVVDLVAVLSTAPATLATAALVVNATTVGMGSPRPDDLPVDPAPLHPGQVVVDIVYRPLETPFLAAARERGARVANGVPMLVHQAAVAFELWTGVTAPVDAMSRSVAELLG